MLKTAIADWSYSIGAELSEYGNLKRILIIEKDKDLLNHIEIYLTKARYAIYKAESLEKGIQILKASVDLDITFDLMLVGLYEGMESLKNILNQIMIYKERIPVIFIGDEFHFPKERISQQEEYSILYKPFLISDLLLQIHSAFNKKG